jgi:hypothetical protein
VLDALISTMLTVIIGMTRDERQACEVVAEASQNLLSKQKAVARTEASDQLVGGCGTRDPRCGGVAAAKQGGWRLLPATLPPTLATNATPPHRFALLGLPPE